MAPRTPSPAPSPAVRPSAAPRLAAVVRGVAPRKSVMSRLTQFQISKPVSVVPYAPERLSITQTAMTPEMMKSISDKGAQRERETKSRKEDSVTTLFAALRMRRVLHRVQAEHGQSGPRVVVDETKDNLERHLKVLSRYKIRQVDTDGDDARQLRNLPSMMVNPHTSLYKLWQLLTLLIIIYQSIMLPFALAFGSNDTTAVDILMSSIFAFDIVVAFNTPIAEDTDESVYITDRWRIASTYLRGWFFFDLLACMPFDYVLLLVNNSKSNLSVLGLLKALRVPRLLRLVRLMRVAKVFKMRPELRRWLQYSRHANLLRLVRLVVSFLIINHYVACFWYGLVMSDQTRALDDSTDPMHLYIVAFYQSLLVVMGQNITVYEDTEYIFCVLAMVVGAVLMAVVFGNVAILIANYYESQSSHQKKMEWLFASMNRMKLPYDLQNRINAYYQAMWERHGTLDGAVTAFIPELSRNLAYEVELFLRMDMINRAPIFQNCSAKVVQELVMELELQVFMPGDYVVVRGEVGNDMYFVQNGICEVTKEIDMPPVPLPRNPSRLSQATQAAQAALHGRMSPSTREINASQIPSTPPAKLKEVVLKVLGQGDYFGEIALLMNCKRTANVRAQVFSELCTLTREVFESISTRYLEDRNIIEKFIMDKYDPSMLQAAMKQSHEVSMRSNGPAAAAAAAARTSSAFPKSQGPSHTMSYGEGTSRSESATAKITGLLNKVLERMDHLEVQLGKESEARLLKTSSHTMMRMGDLTLQPTAPIPPEIEGYLKKLKRKTRSLAGNWNKRWFFVDPRRREFGYSDNRTSAPRSSIYLDDITAVVQFDDTHFQVESRTRNFFLCGESKASTACWVTSLEGYRKKLIEYEKDKIAFTAAAATAAAKASAAAAALCIEAPQQSPPPAAAREPRQAINKKKKSRDSSDPEERQPARDSFGSSSSSSMSSTASSSKSKREGGKAEYSPSDRLPPKSEQRSPSPLAKDTRRPSSHSKNRSPPPSPPSPGAEKKTRDRPRDRERGRDRDRDRKFERESKRESSNDRDRSGNSDRERSGNSDRDRSRDRNARAPTVRGSVMQAWVDDF
ncbi:hypothetical protein PRIC2_001335 [Phytophthora ramorum]|uniref:Potassium/sodium hyperpolarization-activated cyclic nucleotide-gated channel 2 n=1 Tax=Phytophthora ramorum TaxID=164328 RepID=UPI0030B4AB01|nr:Potassium/sodium hyperpolarization-activated cyclic nucleotide-gated channel 2 [Phytophthora ramorum]